MASHSFGQFHASTWIKQTFYVDNWVFSQSLSAFCPLNFWRSFTLFSTSDIPLFFIKEHHIGFMIKARDLATIDGDVTLWFHLED
jgi:hypothetical protein